MFAYVGSNGSSIKNDIYFLLTECEVRTVSYGPLIDQYTIHQLPNNKIDYPIIVITFNKNIKYTNTQGYPYVPLFIHARNLFKEVSTASFSPW